MKKFNKINHNNNNKKKHNSLPLQIPAQALDASC